jgi:single-strand DNA-binding protein
MSFNKIIIVGYLGRDPEMRKTPQGTAYCELAVATNQKIKTENITTWFRVTFWGAQAELAAKYLAKGRLVYLEGTLRTREWNDREGKARFALEVRGHDLQLIKTQQSEAAHADAK